MSVRTTAARATAPVRPRTAAATLLSRRATLYLPEPDPTPVGVPVDRRIAKRGGPDVVAAAGVVLLEADLLHRGILVSPELRQRLSELSIDQLTVHGAALLADVDAALGADRPMVPLFRGFPRSVPRDTLALWVGRVLAYLCQYPEQPCVLCGTVDTIHAVSPCAHLVCSACFDGGDYSACPICHRRIDPNDPFLKPLTEPPRRPRSERQLAMPQRARVVTLGRDASADAYEEIAKLLARTSALSPADSDDLLSLLQLRDRGDLGWLPDSIPSREARALVLAWLLDDPRSWSTTLATAAAHITTATDALRLLAVRSGGDAGLVSVPRFGPVPRPLRRALLAALDRLDTRNLAEDLSRNRRMWIRAAERLHPFEYARRYPNAAAAFAILRETPIHDDPDPLATLLRDAAAEHGFDLAGGKLTASSFAGRVEQRLAAGDVAGAVRLLRTRPGEFLRRLDHVLRLATRAPAGPGPETVLDAIPSAAAAVAPAVLISTLGALRTRTAPPACRVFFPKGGNAKCHVIPEDRAPLPAEVVAEVSGALTDEILRRCGELPTVDVAVIDRDLDGIIAPFTQRTAARALVTLPRGSTLPIPSGRYLRLFLHWTEGEQQVDLDLSAAFFDQSWQHIGTCDYTSLRWADHAAVHSGDLTSAPPPLGASEFLDLDLALLAAAGARYAVCTVMSYNNVAFDDMPEAFAGLMVRDDAPDQNAIFEPRSVEQRFDLAGRARVCLPFVADLDRRTMHWLDVAQGVTGTHHAVHRHADHLATQSDALLDHYASGVRVSLGELATWHAAARARSVLVREPDGSSLRYDRRDGESAAQFAARIRSAADPSSAGGPAQAGTAPAGLALLVTPDDVALAPGASVYALYPGALAADDVRLLAADEVAAQLSPQPAEPPASR